MDINTIIEFDRQLLLGVNGSSSLFIDGLAVVLTAPSTWIPLYVALFYLVMRNNESARQIILVVAGALLCILLAGTLDDTLVKPLVARWRPTHDPAIGMLVDTVNNYRGGKYGFFSAHAANTFSIAIYFCLMVRSRVLSTAMILWSLVNCWTRMYLGVHFPGDIVCGLLWGAVVGTVIALVCTRLKKRLDGPQSFISSQYTSTGYLRYDVNIVMNVLMLTMCYVVIKACVTALA